MWASPMAEPRRTRRSIELPEGAFGVNIAVGLSYSGFAEKIVAEGREQIDFVEIPLEQLVHTLPPRS